MDVVIRKARDEDLDAIGKLVGNDPAWISYGFDEKRAREMVKRMPDQAYVAEIGDRIVGVVTLRPNGFGHLGCFLRMIVVDPEFRGQGIGHALLCRAWTLSREHGKSLFAICSADNTAACKFFEQEGFTAVGQLPSLVVEGRSEVLYWKTAGPVRDG
ncbi:MAG: GNAT family N-acetyltransferase [Bacillota bacterium]|uniref:GNAT family N-acetyltransferase n=1 Tax=unclassified Candidatus Desulforudis TaxID=2635950 RepID=UPI003BBA5D87